MSTVFFGFKFLFRYTIDKTPQKNVSEPNSLSVALLFDLFVESSDASALAVTNVW